MLAQALKRKNHIRQGSPVVDAVLYALAGILCFVTLYPLYYVLILSLSAPEAAATMHVYVVPKGFSLDSYRLIVNDGVMWRSYLNTLIYVFSILVLRIISCLLCAYPLTVSTLGGRKLVVAFLIVPMYFSGGMIPTFLLVQRLGMYDKMIAIIIPSAVSIWHIILMRTYLAGLPNALRESAFIDGASHWRILRSIFMPLAKPIIAVISIYTIVDVWNGWFSAMIYLPSRELQPLQMHLRRVLVEQSVDLTRLNSNEIEAAAQKQLSSIQLRYAMIIFTSLPVLFTYPFFQRYFIKGVMVGSLKG